MRAHITRALGLSSLWSGIEGEADTGQGPMVALFGPETYIEDSADLLDLAAPDSILKKGEVGAAGNGEMEWGYRLSQAMSIYGGTSEIMRSIIAQASLGMPRSRS